MLRIRYYALSDRAIAVIVYTAESRPQPQLCDSRDHEFS